MSQDFRRDASNAGVEIVESIQRGTNCSRILPETAKRLFFAVKQMRVAGLERFHQCLVISTAGPLDGEYAYCRGDQSHQIKLLWGQPLLPYDHDCTRDECACLLRHAAQEGAYLIAAFLWHHIEHGLIGRVRNAGEPEHLNKTKRNHHGKNGQERETGKPDQINKRKDKDANHDAQTRKETVREK